MLSAAKHLPGRATAAGHRATRSVRQQGARRTVRSFGLWPQDDSGRVLSYRAQRSIWPGGRPKGFVMLSAAKHLAGRATAAGHRATRSVRQQGVRRLVRSFGLWPQDDTGRVLSYQAQRSIWPAGRPKVLVMLSAAKHLPCRAAQGSCHAERSEASGLPNHCRRPSSHPVGQAAGRPSHRRILRPAASG